MKYKGDTLIKTICLLVYYLFAQYLPQSGRIFNIGGLLRRYLCQKIFLKCGEKVNIERKAYFGNGANICIGSYSGIGVNAIIPNDTIIGDYVMMGPNCYILSQNHAFDRVDIPMGLQGFTETKRTIIEDDCWIGRDVLMTPGRHISQGSIIAARCCLTKDFPPFSVVGGNPSKFIKQRNI